jgi:hypothetical protein
VYLQNFTKLKKKLGSRGPETNQKKVKQGNHVAGHDGWSPAAQDSVEKN